MPNVSGSAGNGNRSIVESAQTGKNPTDRGKNGSKIHILVDEMGAPLALQITGANEHDKWSADDLLVGIVIEPPDPEEVEQHLCADKGYDFDDVHEAVAEGQYEPHIKHRRRRNEPKKKRNPFLMKSDILLVDGWLSAPSVGWENAAVFACAGAKRRKTGWP